VLKPSRFAPLRYGKAVGIASGFVIVIGGTVAAKTTSKPNITALIPITLF